VWQRTVQGAAHVHRCCLPYTTLVPLLPS
jgi:hypothetical protein